MHVGCFHRGVNMAPASTRHYFYDARARRLHYARDNLDVWPGGLQLALLNTKPPVPLACDAMMPEAGIVCANLLREVRFRPKSLRYPNDTVSQFIAHVAEKNHLVRQIYS